MIGEHASLEGVDHVVVDSGHSTHAQATAVEERIATLLGLPSISPAKADFVREHTGQPIGGVPPVGHPEPIGTLVDIELARHEQVWAAAGHPSAVFPTTYEELLRLTDGTAAEVGDGPRSPSDIGLPAGSAP